jgi:site-specific recombinase XerD
LRRSLPRSTQPIPAESLTKKEVGKLIAEFKADPLVAEWVGTLTSQSAKELYPQFLYTYFTTHVKGRGYTLKTWVDEIGSQQTSANFKDRRAWATELQGWVNNHITQTGKLYTSKSRKVIVTAIKSFLQFQLGELEGRDSIKTTSSEQRLIEAKQKDEMAPISVQEFKKLVNEATTKRDRAMLLSLACGMGVGEWVQFAREWWKYADQIRAKNSPLRVNVIRPKTASVYFVLMWDDAVEALSVLLEDREHEVGRPLKKGDELFVNQVGGPLIDSRVQRTIRELAVKSGIEAREKGRIVYRIRPHEIGRDFFRTLAENAEIPTTVAEFSIGHLKKIDPLEYNRFYRTPEGQARIENYLGRLRPLLNVVSGKGIEAEGPSTRECCRLAATLAIQLHISEEEAHSQMLHSLYQNHKELFGQVTERIQAKPLSKEAKMAGEETAHYGHLQVLTHEEMVTLAVDVAMTKGNGQKLETKKIGDTDETAYEQAVAEGFVEAGRINGFRIMKREK